jgi:hypothetical protein
LVGGICVLAVVSSLALAQQRRRGPAPIVGRWDLIVHGKDGDYPSWLEVRVSGRRTLVGRYVGQFGSQRPISNVELRDDHFRFSVPPQWEGRKDDVVIEGRVVGPDSLQGEVTDDKGGRLTWTGRRAPSLKREKERVFGKELSLIGNDLTGWKPRHAEVKNGWVVKDGLLIDEKPGNDIVSEQKFTDFKLHAEFRYPKGSNSGIYLRGRYEVQIEDNYGEEPDNLKIGGVYGFLTPSVNAAKKPGEWQEVDITLVGRVVTVVFNGERVIDRQTIPGITGGALDSDEGAPGPIMLQGDHGPVEFRNVKIWPAE